MHPDDRRQTTDNRDNVSAAPTLSMFARERTAMAASVICDLSSVISGTDEGGPA